MNNYSDNEVLCCVPLKTSESNQVALDTADYLANGGCIDCFDSLGSYTGTIDKDHPEPVLDGAKVRHYIALELEELVLDGEDFGITEGYTFDAVLDSIVSRLDGGDDDE